MRAEGPTYHHAAIAILSDFGFFPFNDLIVFRNSFYGWDRVEPSRRTLTMFANYLRKKHHGRDMDEHYDTLDEMMGTLAMDATRSSKELKERSVPEDRDYWARVHARAVFAFIEGVWEMLRRQAFVAEANKITRQVNIGRLAVLAGEEYSVTDEGEIKCKKMRISFKSHLFLALNSYAEAQGSTHRCKKGADWHRILDAIDVRDRITHPKNLKSLHISDNELASVNFAFEWTWNEVATILNAIPARPPTAPKIDSRIWG